MKAVICRQIAREAGDKMGHALSITEEETFTATWAQDLRSGDIFETVTAHTVEYREWTIRIRWVVLAVVVLPDVSPSALPAGWDSPEQGAFPTLLKESTLMDAAYDAYYDALLEEEYAEQNDSYKAEQDESAHNAGIAWELHQIARHGNGHYDEQWEYLGTGEPAPVTTYTITGYTN